MTEIIQAIDDWTESYLPDLNKKLWGFCELAHRTVNNNYQGGSDQPTVMTINGTSDRQNVTLDDRYEFITWVRLPNRVLIANNPEWDFGFKEARFQTAQFRWVIAHKVELGEDLIYEIADAFPEQLSVNGFQFVFTNPQIDIDYDHESIYQTELGKTVYEKHRFPWNVYVINLSVEFKLCEPVTSN